MAAGIRCLKPYMQDLLLHKGHRSGQADRVQDSQADRRQCGFKQFSVQCREESAVELQLDYPERGCGEFFWRTGDIHSGSDGNDHGDKRRPPGAGCQPSGHDARFAKRPHSVHVVLNGSELGVFTGSGISRFSGSFTIPESLLREGTNSMVLNTLGSNDVSYFDSATINYTRRYAADQNRLFFQTPGYRKVNLTGFASPNIRVFDTTHRWCSSVDIKSRHRAEWQHLYRRSAV